MKSFRNILSGRSIFGRRERSSSADSGSHDYLVTFTGGMGAQIISAALYHNLRNAGHTVHADLSYFDSAPHVAREGNPGDCSHWGWQLDCFGLARDSFNASQRAPGSNTVVLSDGIDKLRLGLEALAKPDVQVLFNVRRELQDNCSDIIRGRYLCVHVRRGDYLNVASHMVSDNEFIGIIGKFKRIFESIVVLSDSGLSQSFRNTVAGLFADAKFLDNIDEVKAHIIMRNAAALICSNSQFSLVAALLNNEGLIVVPKQWFNGKNRMLETVIDDKCRFQMFTD